MKSKQHRWFLTTLRRKNSLYCRIDVWGFVNVMLALLVLLMFGLPNPSYGNRGGVDMATAVHSIRMPAALREDAMWISMSRDGKIYFGNLHIGIEDVPNEIREGLKNGTERKVYLAVYAHAKYGDVPCVLDKIRLAGVEKVAFLTR